MPIPRRYKETSLFKKNAISGAILAAKAEITVTTEGIASEVSKITSAKYIATGYNYTLAQIRTYAVEGYSGTWTIASTPDIRVGDTIYLKVQDTTRVCPVYIKTTVDIVNSATSIKCTSHGYEDILPVDTIKSTINQSADSIQIEARHVDVEGAAIFSSGGAYDKSTTVVKSETQWYSSTNATSKNDGSWGTTQPIITAGRYIWQRELVTYANGRTEYKPSEAGVCIQGQTDLSDYSTTTQMDTALAEKANTSSAVSRTQRIYYRTNTALLNSITGPTTWINESGNKYNTTAPTTATTGWSTKPTPLATSTTTNVNKYLYLYTCIQTQTVSQAANNGTQCSTTTILLDDTETIIDGEKIITGSIAANRINVTDLQAFGATIGGFTIDSSSVHTKDVAVTSNTDNSIALSSADFTRTISGISRNGLRFAIGDKFAVTGDGAIYASSADITGKITATSGTIGGASIDSNGKLQLPAAQVSGKLTADQIEVSGISISGLSGYPSLTNSINSASETASNYIHADSTGINIYDNSLTNASKYYLRQTASGTYIYRNSYLKAKYEDTITLYGGNNANGANPKVEITGNAFNAYDENGKKRTSIDKNGLHIYNNDTNNTETGLFGAATARIGATNGPAFEMNADNLRAYYGTGTNRKLYFEVGPNGMSYGPALNTTVATTLDIPTTVAELTDSSNYLTTQVASTTYATQNNLAAETNRRKAIYGTCSTAASTAAKVITCENFESYTGARINIKFSTANTAAAPTLKIQNASGTELLAAKAIWNENAVASATNPVLWGANATITFVYDGSVWIVENKPASYSVSCDTGAAIQAKAPTVAGAIVMNGTTVTVNFSVANTYASGAVQLNLSDTGAANIYKNGTVTSSSNKLLWNANTDLTFTRKGQYWYLASRSDADQTADAYIVQDSTGIKVFNSSDSLGYVHIGPYGMTIYGTNSTNDGSVKRALFGFEEIDLYDWAQNTRVLIDGEGIILYGGTTNQGRLQIDYNQIKIIDANDKTRYWVDGTNTVLYDKNGKKCITIDEKGLHVFSATNTRKIAMFGTTDGDTPITRIGKRNAGDTAFEKGGIEIGTTTSSDAFIKMYSGSTILFHAGYDTVNTGESENTTTATEPYYTFGVRDSDTVITWTSSAKIKFGNIVTYNSNKYLNIDPSASGSTGITYSSSSTFSDTTKWKSLSYTKLIGGYSTVIGKGSALGSFSYSMGRSVASGYSSFAEGRSIATGSHSHSEGMFTLASGTYGHTEGYKTKASGNYSHAEGESSIASGTASHAEGLSTTASGGYSHAEGYQTTASGIYSFAAGFKTTANVEAQFVCGYRNKTVSSAVFIVGDGNNDEATNLNAMTVLMNGGGTYIKGSTSSNGTNVTSDIRIKENIKLLDNNEAINFIKQLKPRSYLKEGKKELGFIAQEIETIDKYGDYLVSLANPEIYEYEDFRLLDYQGLIAPTIAALQAALEKIETLEAKVKALENK